MTRFAGANLHGPAGLNRPQGGLLDDSAARGGLGVIDRELVFTLIVHADPSTGGFQGLTQAQQDQFLSGVTTSSRTMYSSHGSFGQPTPEPSTLTLLALGLLGLGTCGRRRS